MTATTRPVRDDVSVDLARFYSSTDRFCTGSSEGTYRTRPLRETLDLLWRDRDSYGVTRVWEISGLDRLGFPVFSAARPNAYRHNLTLSNGKGLSRIASLVSALAEAFERHWGEPQHHAMVEASLADLVAQGRGIADPRAVGVCTSSSWTETTSITWMEFVDTANGSVALVPAEYAVAPYLPPGGVAIRPSATDGIACGNTAHPI